MVTSVWYLKPNFDDSQDMRHALGDKPEIPVEVRPGPVQDLAAVATGTNAIRLTWTAVTGATNYNIQRSPDNAIWSDIDSIASSPYNSINLVPDSTYWYRVFTENEYGWGPVSNTASATTEAIVITPPGDPIFADDFNNYSVGDSVAYKVPPIAAAGVRWNWNSGSPALVGTGGMDGGNCLDFNFKEASYTDDGSDNTSSYCEQQIQLCADKGSALSECWVEFYLKITSQGRDQGGSANDKFVAFHNDNYADGGRPAYGRMSAVLNTWGSQNDRWCTFSWTHYAQNADKVAESWHNHEAGGTPPYGPGYPGEQTSWNNNWVKSANGNPSGATLNALQAADAGEWVRHRAYCKINDIGQANGHMTWWRDDDVILDVPQIYREWLDGYNKMDGIYLLGWMNRGFTADTTWKIDKVSVWAENPGWT